MKDVLKAVLYFTACYVAGYAVGKAMIKAGLAPSWMN